MLSRDEPQLAGIWSLPSLSVTEPAMACDLAARTVSHDPATGARTLLLQMPAGWAATTEAAGAIELFVLEGKVMVDGHELAPAGYVYAPAGAGASLRSPAGAAVLLFWTPEPRIAVDELVALSAWSVPWESTTIPGFPRGPMHKSLRPCDAGGDAHGSPDGFLRIVLVTPGWVSPCRERHVGCWEENIMLQGDMLMPGRGSIGPGDTLANPKGFWHGPMATKTGALFLVNCDAPMPVEYREEPVCADELRRYLDETPWAGTEAARRALA